MRRVVPVLLATAGVLILLSTFHTTTVSTTPLAAPVPTSTTADGTTTTTSRPAPTEPPPGPDQGFFGDDEDGGPPVRTGPTTTTTTAALKSGQRSYDGKVVTNRWGEVQVRIVVEGGKLVDAQALRLPTDRARSAYISEQAGPMLRSEAIQAGNANIYIIGGATYTSESYAESLQSALDQAGIK
ncbi:MAG: hypothetical protein U0V73_12940 [Acidimicrobiia bacterium]